MRGDHTYGAPGPDIQPCPYCNHPTECDTVDVGVGFVQCGPYHCDACGASEIGPNDEKRELTPDEKRTGWYAPGSPPGSSANVIGGKIVSARVMNAAYRDRFYGNSEHAIPGVVEDWFAKVRKDGL